MSDQNSPLIVRVSEKILKHRWVFVFFITMMVFIIELEEHQWRGSGYLGPDFWRETVLFGLMVPVSFGVLLSLLFYVRKDKDDAVRSLDQQHVLSQKLSHSGDWNDLTTTIVQFPASVLPVSAVCLRTYNDKSGRFDLANYWASSGSIQTELAVDIEREICKQCVLPGKSAPLLKPCHVLNKNQVQSPFNSYCLPLSHQQELVALLHLHFKGDPTLTEKQLRLVYGAAPEMAMAIATERLHINVQQQAEASNEERRRIARDLHDTLGQNISYLRLKLDQLTGEDTLREISVIELELERMRDIANDAYIQVRDTLAELQPETQKDLISSMREHINVISSRAGFQYDLRSDGPQIILPASVSRQVMFIFREILNNIEKHAEARLVKIRLRWEAEVLQISVQDNGKGFDTAQAAQVGHYGLHIMEDRSADIGARLELISTPGKGTQISLRLPIQNMRNIPCQKTPEVGQINDNIAVKN